MKQAIQILTGQLCVQHGHRATWDAPQLLDALRPDSNTPCVICAYEELVVAAQKVRESRGGAK